MYFIGRGEERNLFTKRDLKEIDRNINGALYAHRYSSHLFSLVVCISMSKSGEADFNS